LVRTRYEAVEADFQRFYGIDLGELWTGEMGPRRAARLASQLPPGSAIYRSEGLDAQVYSLEAQLLRTLINMKIEKKHERIPTADEAMKRAQKEDQIKQRREIMGRNFLARIRESGDGVSDG
jgi:hypothetical protein